MDKEKKRTIITLVGFCLLFIILVAYLSYFQIFKAEEVKNNPYNKRLWINEEKVLRGSIEDRNGTVLAYSEKTEEANKRYYNYGRLYSHIIGYSYREYGKAGLELSYNNTLLNINESATINDIKNIVLPSSVGNDLVLTIDHNLQAKSRELLANSGQKGSIVTMNPQTGEIYSMVSLPDFDTANLQDGWKGLTEDPNSPLLNRATQGLYSPGSTFKILSTTALMEYGSENREFDCNGSALVDGYTFNDYNKIAHGHIDLRGAVINSCNPYFTTKIQDVTSDEFGNVAEKFMFNKPMKFDISLKTSSFPYKNGLSKTEMGAASIGQGQVLSTPLNMLMMVSSIANEGAMMKPRLVKAVKDSEGKIIKDFPVEEISRVTSPFTAREISSMLRGVVTEGTGRNASIKNVAVVGKTGTAENSSGKSHSWFVGYASEDNPRIAVVVLLEESGLTGGQGAAPIARDLMIYALNNMKFD